MYSVRIEGSFSAAHQLRGYDGDCEQVHGHNWRVEAEVVGKEPGKHGMLVDFRELKRLLGEVLGELDHQMLNELAAFKKENPTSENVARHIYTSLEEKLGAHPGVKLDQVRVHESEGSSATYSET